MEQKSKPAMDYQAFLVSKAAAKTVDEARAMLPSGARAVEPVEAGGMWVFEMRPREHFQSGKLASMKHPVKPGVRALVGPLLEGQKYMQRYRQSEVNYKTLSDQLTAGKACVNCRWFVSEGSWFNGDTTYADQCNIVDGWPLDIEEIGLCDKHEAAPLPTPYEPPPMPVYVVPDPDTAETGALATIKGLISKLIGRPPALAEAGFKAISDDRWFSWWTNNAEDKKKQLFSEAAIDDYIAAVKAGDWDYPELWFSHIPGTSHGQADAIGRLGHVVWATGTFNDSWQTPVYREYYKSAKSLTVSHGYWWTKGTLDETGVYDWFRTFEISTLRKPYFAINEFTGFSLGENAVMADKATLTPDEQRELKALGFDDDQLKVIEAEAAQKSKEIETAGKRVKADLDDKAAGETVEARLAALEASHKADLESAVKPLTDQISGLVKLVTTLTTDVKAVQGKVEAAQNLEKPASKSDKTVVDPDDTQAANLNKLNLGQHILQGKEGELDVSKFFPMFTQPDSE
jgi:hypothetical protein